MAVLENKRYYKIISDKCYVDNFVHVCFVEYKSESDRENEKATENVYNNFINNIYDILDAQESNEFNDRVYAVLSEIESNRVICDFNHTPKTSIDSDILDFLKQNGYNSKWITNPIYKFPERIVCCGIYNNEKTDMEFYYNALKSVMNDTVSNV